MDYTEEILKVLSTELRPYSTIDGQVCVDGVLTSAHKLNELFQQKLQKMNTLQEIIKEMEDDFSSANRLVDLSSTAELKGVSKALEKYIPKLMLLLSDKDTEAIKCTDCGTLIEGR